MACLCHVSVHYELIEESGVPHVHKTFKLAKLRGLPETDKHSNDVMLLVFSAGQYLSPENIVYASLG